jgi:hypothetical protein
VRIAVAEAAEADRFSHSSACAGLGVAAPWNSSPAATLPSAVRQGIRLSRLEHVAGAPVEAVEPCAEHLDRAAARREQAGGDVEQRAFAAAVGPTTETNSPAPTVRLTSRTAV